jgi:hypothetical protein
MWKVTQNYGGFYVHQGGVWQGSSEGAGAILDTGKCLQMAPPIKAFDRAHVDELEPESEPGRSSTK